jgi:transcriptional regulator with XRE-family HTH domain
MQLRAYLQHQGLSSEDFARRMGNASPQAVIKWARGERFPRPAALRRIEEVTEGEVRAADFYEAFGAASAAQAERLLVAPGSSASASPSPSEAA